MQKGLFLAIFCMTYVHVDVIALSVDSCASSETNTHIVFHAGSQFFFRLVSTSTQRHGVSD